MANSMWAQIESRNPERKPEVILKEQCDIISDQYPEVLLARTQRMDKSLDEYTKGPLANMTDVMSGIAGTRSVDSLLGETDDDKSITYELFVTSPRIPSYKYRILFLQHGLSAYPTYVYVEKPIRDEIQDTQFPKKVENESDFLTLIREVLGSERVRDVLSRIVSYDDDF